MKQEIKGNRNCPIGHINVHTVCPFSATSNATFAFPLKF